MVGLSWVREGGGCLLEGLGQDPHGAWPGCPSSDRFSASGAKDGSTGGHRSFQGTGQDNVHWDMGHGSAEVKICQRPTTSSLCPVGHWPQLHLRGDGDRISGRADILLTLLGTETPEPFTHADTTESSRNSCGHHSDLAAAHREVSGKAGHSPDQVQVSPVP